MGAIRAVCHPFSTANQMHAAATMVLPLPTSPWHRRFMGLPDTMSSTASAMARRWAPVRAKGSRR